MSENAKAHRASAKGAAILCLIGSMGCHKPDPYDGLYIRCDGTADHLYYKNNGIVIDYFSLPCLGPEFFSYETGGAETGGIDLEKWTNDTEDIDSLRTMCVEACLNHGGTECKQENGKMWDIRNYDQKIVPDPLMEITDPSHFGCWLSRAKLAPLPWETMVIPIGSGATWPSDGQAITIECGDFETCANEFAAPITTVLYYDDTAVPWGPNMGYADDLVTTTDTNSTLGLTLFNHGSAPSSDSNEVGGQFEYTASDCDEVTCPFYLANLTLFSSQTWELWSEDLKDDVLITNVAVQLRRPTLGVWKTSSNEFYLGEERLEALVGASIQIGANPPVEMGFLVANAEAVFGEIGAGGTIEILDFVADDGASFEIQADLHFDTLVLSSSIEQVDGSLP